MWLFFDKLITVQQLDPASVVSESLQSGARHQKYFAEGSQIGYWDSFSVSIVECIQTLLADNANQKRAIYAWQKFIRVVIDQMRIGYLDEEQVANDGQASEDVS